MISDRLMTTTFLVTFDIASEVKTRPYIRYSSRKRAKKMNKLRPGCSSSQTTSKFSCKLSSTTAIKFNIVKLQLRYDNIYVRSFQ